MLFIMCLYADTGEELTVAHNTTVELTCIDQNDDGYYPGWYWNASAPGSMYNTAGGTGELIGTLIINGNHTCGTFNAYCRLHSGQIKHNSLLTVGG